VIAVDSSVLVGLIRGERDLAALSELLFREPVAIAAPAVAETRIWCARKLRSGMSAWLEAALRAPTVLVAPFTGAMADAAAAALRAMGRGTGHPARLNFGDALVYGHAAVMGLPLLFKGGDFNHTDLRLDPRSVVLA
jgi:ribonuclease VapC